MSDIGGVGPVAVGRLILDAGGVEAGAATAVGAISNIGNISGSTYFGLRNLGLGFEALGAAATGSLALAVSQATSWEAAMTRIQIAADNTAQAAGQQAGSFSEVEQGLRNIAQTAPFTISSIESVATALADEGLRGQTLIETTKQVLELHAETGASTEQLAGFLAKVGAAFGFSASDARGFASALLAVSQNTPATIADIISLEQRTNAAGREAGISAEGMLGLNASLASLPQNARLAGSALTNLITSMSDVVSKGGPQLTTIADVSGRTTDQFVSDWRDKPEQAIARFIEGLGALRNNVVEQQNAIANLGITNARAQATIIGWADAQAGAADKTFEVSNAIKTVDEAMAAQSLTGIEMARITETTSSQMQILHNNIDLAAQSFGSVLLPIINPVIQAFTNIAAGIALAPPWLRLAIELMFGFTAVIGVTGGALLILLPRILQGVAGVQTLAQAWRDSAAAQLEHLAVTEASDAEMAGTINAIIAEAEARGLDTEATQALVAAQYEALGIGPALAATMAEAAVSEDAAAAATVGLAEATTGLGLSMNLVLPGITLVGLALAGLTALWMAGSNATDDAANANQNFANTDESLIAAIQREANGVKFATDQWILHKLAIDGTLETLQKAGVSAADVVGVIKGQGGSEAVNNINNALQSTGDVSADAASKAIKSLTELNGVYDVSAAAAASLAKSDGELGDAQDGVGNTADDAATGLEALKNQAQQVKSALEGLAQDETSVEQATINLAQAQDELAQAQSDLENKASIEDAANQRLTKSIDDLAIARDKEAQAAVDADRARAIAQENVRKAQDDLTTSKANEVLANQRVTEAQNALNQAQSRDETSDLARATNELNDARMRLVYADLAVSDAEWQLNYLREEGASARDITDAQNTLTDAKNNQADATTKVADAQSKLNDVTSGANQAKAEADLAIALAARDQATMRVTDDTNKLNDAQLALSQDVGYLEAQSALAQAHINVDTAIQGVSKATNDLHAIETGSIERNYEQATLRVKDALVAQATANVNLQVAEDALHGKFDTSVEKARMMGGQLITLGNQMGGPVGSALVTMGTQLIDGANYMQGLNDRAQNASGGVGAVGGAANTTGAQLDNLNSKRPFTISFMDVLTSYFQGLWGLVSSSWTDSPFMNFINSLKSGDAGGILGAASDLANPTGTAVKKVLEMVGISLSEGGYFTRPTLAVIGDDGPELALPLNKPSRMMDLLSRSGVLSSLNTGQLAGAGVAAPFGSSGSSVTNNKGGDVINITALSQADPSDIAEEIMWVKRTRPS